MILRGRTHQSYVQKYLQNANRVRALEEEVQVLEASRRECHDKINTNEQALGARRTKLGDLQAQIVEVQARLAALQQDQQNERLDLSRIGDSLEAERAKLDHFNQLIEAKWREARSIIDTDEPASEPTLRPIRALTEVNTTGPSTPTTPGARKLPLNFEYDSEKNCYEYSCSKCDANVTSQGTFFAGRQGVCGHLGKAHKPVEGAPPMLLAPRRKFWPEEEVEKLLRGEITYQVRWGINKFLGGDSVALNNDHCAPPAPDAEDDDDDDDNIQLASSIRQTLTPSQSNDDDSLFDEVPPSRKRKLENREGFDSSTMPSTTSSERPARRHSRDWVAPEQTVNNPEEPVRKQSRISTSLDRRISTTSARPAESSEGGNYNDLRRPAYSPPPHSANAVPCGGKECSLHVVQPFQKGRGPTCTEDDVKDAINEAWASKEENRDFDLFPQRCGLVDVFDEGSGFKCLFRTKEHAENMCGSMITLAGRVKELTWYQPREPGRAKIFQITRVPKDGEALEDVIEALTRNFPTTTFALYQRRIGLGTVPGYWVVFREPVFLIKTIELRRVKHLGRRTVPWTALMCRPRTDPCGDCGGSHRNYVCPDILPLEIKHPMLRGS